MNFPRRIVGDYDVDRLQVQVWQHIQPRSTNHPFGLIPVFELVNASGREWFAGCGCCSRNEFEVLRADVRERHAAERQRQRQRQRRAGAMLGCGCRGARTTRVPVLERSSRSTAGPPSGGQSAVEPPGPIPNPEVKRRSADGSGTTGPVRVGRRQVYARLP